MLMDGENQCGDDLDDWFHFALNIVVSVIQIVCSKDGYGPNSKAYPYQAIRYLNFDVLQRSKYKPYHKILDLSSPNMREKYLYYTFRCKNYCGINQK